MFLFCTKGLYYMNEKSVGLDWKPSFDDQGLVFDFGSANECPEIIAKLGVSLGTFFGFSSSIAVGGDADAVTDMAIMALASGLMFSGSNVRLMRETALPVMRWVCRQGIVDGSIYVSGQTEKRIYILNNHGNNIDTAEEKNLELIYSNLESDGSKDAFVGVTENISAPEEFYVSFVMDVFPEAYRCLDFSAKKLTQNLKNIVCAVIVSKLYPNAPVFVPRSCYSSVLKILGRGVDVVCTENTVGEIMAEMEKFIDIDGVYQQYLMMFDDFAFDVAISHFKAMFGLDELRKIAIPRIYRKNEFIDCGKCGETDFFDYLLSNNFLSKTFRNGEALFKNNDNGLAFIVKNPLEHRIEICIEGYREEYADEITGEIEHIFGEYSCNK